MSIKRLIFYLEKIVVVILILLREIQLSCGIGTIITRKLNVKDVEFLEIPVASALWYSQDSITQPSPQTSSESEGICNLQ